MEQPQLGETAALVVRIEETVEGRWQLQVESAESAADLPILPATFIIRVWQASDASVLRGTIHLHGSRHSAAIQSNTQLIELVRAWLYPMEKNVAPEEAEHAFTPGQ